MAGSAGPGQPPLFPYDWARFFRERVDLVAPRAPLGGLTMSGYELRYQDKPSAASLASAKEAEASVGFTYSLGFGIDKDKKLTTILWGSPAFDAALRTGDEIIAVGERAYSEDVLKDAITAAKSGQQPIRLTIKRDDMVRPYSISYNGGLRYPHLVKTGRGDGPLDLLLKAR